MIIYCVMRGEARCDLDHVVYASVNKEKAENYAMKYGYTTFDGEPYIEELDVDEEANANASDN